MPIENEIKYILSSKLSEDLLNTWKKISVRQGYLNDGPRIRQYGDEYIFTYKRWLKDENAQVEIETDLSEKDFQRLWALCTKFVTKNRYIKKDGDIEWAVDFLKDKNGDTYFTLAEAEMPEGMAAPKNILEEIKPYIIYQPQKGDKKYTNKKLSNIDYAKKRLKKICP